MEGPDFRSWFGDDELERCPNCGEFRLIRGMPYHRFRVCLDCGIVEIPDAADVSAHRDPPEPPSDA
jgi:ribosomal protein L32